MADEYIDLPVETDETAIYNAAVAQIQAIYPNWNPAQTSLVNMLLRVCAGMAAIGAENASTVTPDIFRYFGKLVQIEPNPAVAATVEVTFTAQDDAGYTVPALTPVGLKTADMDTPVAFFLGADLVIPNGSTSNISILAANDTGEIGNNLDTVVRLDSLSYITSVTISGPSSGGTDAELTSDFLDRLSRTLETLTTTPITERQFAIVATLVPGVYRAAAWANYNPDDETTDNDKYVTVAALDSSGVGVSGPVKTLLLALYGSLREVNFVPRVIDPTESLIDVQYTAHCTTLADSAIVEGNIVGELQTYIDRKVWGLPVGSTKPVPVWKNSKTVRLNKVIKLLETVVNVDYVSGVEIGLHGDALVAADLALPGAFPIAQLGTVTPTIDLDS